MLRVLWFGLLLAAGPVLRADPLLPIRQARAMLGPAVWSRVLLVDNRISDPRHPLRFPALVFALEGRLWLYDANEGTQSLSFQAGRLEADKADPGPLLRRFLPSVTGFRDLTAEVDRLPPLVGAGRPPRTWRDRLPFGCFIECFARWRELTASATPPDSGGILAIYFDTSAGHCGHSALVYTSGNRRFIYDPDDEAAIPSQLASAPSAPLDLARAFFPLLAPHEARLLALHDGLAPNSPAATAVASRGNSAEPSRRPDRASSTD